MVELFRFFMPLLILVGGVAIFFLFKSLRTPPQSHPLLEREFPLVRTAAVEANPRGVEIVVDGTVVPYREIQIAAEVGGRIVEKKTRSGYFVTAGTKLIQIDPTNYDLDARRAAEEVKQAELQMQENTIEEENVQRLIELARADLELQKKDLDRITALHERGSLSASELDQTKRAHLASQVSLAQLENQLRMIQQRYHTLETALAKAQVQQQRTCEDLKRTAIIAPCEGIIVRDETEEDSYVSVGKQLFTLEDTSKTEVRCQLRAEDIYWLWLQQQNAEKLPSDFLPTAHTDYQIPEAAAWVEHSIAGRTYRWQGVLKRYESSGLDSLTRMAPVRVEVPNPREVFVQDDVTPDKFVRTEISEGPPALTRGFFVKVTIHATPDTTLLQVPESAIQPGNRILRMVQKVQEITQLEESITENNSAAANGILDIQNIQVVRRTEGTALIRSPNGTLIAGDRVIISPLSFIEQGMIVHEVTF